MDAEKMQESLVNQGNRILEPIPSLWMVRKSHRRLVQAGGCTSGAEPKRRAYSQAPMQPYLDHKHRIILREEVHGVSGSLSSWEHLFFTNGQMG